MCNTNFSYDKKKYVCFYEEGTQLLKELDDKFMKFISEIEYKEVHIPSLIQGEVLEKCGYFQAFPQHLTAVCSLVNIDKKIYNRNELTSKDIRLHDYYLTPAACVHIYPMLEKECKTSTCYTTLEAVYRYENGKFEESERLWEFSVREFVFVGSKEYVGSSLEMMKKKALHLAKQYFTDARIVMAHDNFYPTQENKIRTKMQVANHLKDELLVKFDNREIAIASFNYHNYHFSKAFNFDKSGEIVTGCVGFGLERWVLCCLEHRSNRV